MIVAYICSPYRAQDKKQRKQYDEYVKSLTKMAIDSGIAPIAPHMYITHVLATATTRTERQDWQRA